MNFDSINKSKINPLLIVIYLLAIYLEIPLVTDDIFVPTIACVLIYPIFYFNSGNLNRDDVRFLTACLIIFSLSMIISPQGITLKKFGGVVQTFFSLSLGLFSMKIILKMNKKIFNRILFYSVCFLFLGSILERLDIIKIFSDIFRNTFYHGGQYGVYDAEARDLELIGFERPKLFTTEPSIMAIGYFAIIVSYLIINYSNTKYFIVLIITILMYKIVGSPVIIGAMIVIHLISLMYGKKGNILINNLLMIIIILTLINFFDGEIKLILNRINYFSNNYEITSENLRVVFPFKTMLDVIHEHPFFGIGISGVDSLNSISTLPLSPIEALGNNNFFSIFIYLGILNGSLFIINIIIYLKKYLAIKKSILLIIIFIIFCFTMGGFQTSRFWGFLFLILSSTIMSDKKYENK